MKKKKLPSTEPLDPQLAEFVKYFDRMEREATRNDYKRMLQDVRDTCEIRLKAIEE